MARPNKRGLDYFPLDTRLDGKLKLLLAEHGAMGIGVVFRLWQLIYGDEGYYCRWDEDTALLFTRENRISPSQTTSVINSCFKRDIFDKTMYDEYGILTSRGIQERYFEATRAAKRKNIQAVNEYLLLSDTPNLVNPGNNSIYSGNNSINSGGNTTNKIKENKIKENKSKVKENIGDKPTIDFLISLAKKQGYRYVDCNRFFDYYNERNWLTQGGKNVDVLKKLGEWDERAKHGDKSYLQRNYTADEYAERNRKRAEEMRRMMMEEDFEV